MIEISVSTINYFLSFFLLACKLYKSGPQIMHYVSDTARYANSFYCIVFGTGK